MSDLRRLLGQVEFELAAALKALNPVQRAFAAALVSSLLQLLAALVERAEQRKET